MQRAVRRWTGESDRHAAFVEPWETATVGAHVKLYQGVTLGAKSFEVDDDGRPVKGVKRHPDIGDHVTIYAHATILGGDTQVGKNSIIGSYSNLFDIVLDDSVIGSDTNLRGETRSLNIGDNTNIDLG